MATTIFTAGWQQHGDDVPRGGPMSSVHALDDASQVGEARRAAMLVAADAGLDETERGTLAVVVTELATNLARHARAGRILLQVIGEPGVAGVEALAIDEGPGMAHLARSFEDGYSTGGTAGKGLGAVQRMASEFDVYTRAQHGGAATAGSAIDRVAGGAPGTVIVARVWSAAALRERETTGAATGPLTSARLIEAGAVSVPIGGETVCGDSWAVLRRPERLLVAVVDGLGHGADAAVASAEAIRVVRASPDASIEELLHAAHAALRATRGAAMALAAIHPARGTLAFGGIGNISAVLHDGRGAAAGRSLASHNGTIGHMMRTVREFQHEWAPGATLVMHSDGLATRWRLDAWPHLRGHHPAIVAGLLWRDAARGRDDATVVALQDTRE